MKLIMITLIVVVFVLAMFFIFTHKAANLEDNDNNSIESNILESKEEEVSQDSIKKRDYLDLQVLVKFKRDLSESELKSFMKENGLEIIGIIENISVYQFKIISDLSVKDMVSKLSKDSLVEYAEPNYVVEFEL